MFYYYVNVAAPNGRRRMITIPFRPYLPPPSDGSLNVHSLYAHFQNIPWSYESIMWREERRKRARNRAPQSVLNGLEVSTMSVTRVKQRENRESREVSVAFFWCKWMTGSGSASSENVTISMTRAASKNGWPMVACVLCAGLPWQNRADWWTLQRCESQCAIIWNYGRSFYWLIKTLVTPDTLYQKAIKRFYLFLARNSCNFDRLLSDMNTFVLIKTRHSVQTAILGSWLHSTTDA